MFFGKTPAEAYVLKETIKKASSMSLSLFSEFFWPCLHGGWGPDNNALQPLIRGWHIDCICAHLEAVTRGEISTLVINIPPGHAKTKLVFTYWSAWEYGPRNLRHLRRIYVSHSSKFAENENNQFRALAEETTFKRFWDLTGKKEDYEPNTAALFAVKGGGRIYATGINGQVTGHRAHRIILDDPNLPKDVDSEAKIAAVRKFYSETVSTRRALGSSVPYGEVLVQQRVSQKDLTAYYKELNINAVYLRLPLRFDPSIMSYSPLKRTASAPSPGFLSRKNWRPVLHAAEQDQEPLVSYFENPDGVTWKDTDLNLTDEQTAAKERGVFRGGVGYPVDLRERAGGILCPDIMSEEVVAGVSRAMGGEHSFSWRAQQQQNPRPRGGSVFDVSKLKVLKEAQDYGVVVRGWDFAYSVNKDKTASVKIAKTKEGTFIILHATAWNKQVGENEEAVANMVRLHDDASVIQDIPKDPGAGGKTAAKSWTSVLSGFPVRSSPETGNKLLRAMPLASQINIGNVIMIRGSWNSELVDALSSFTEDRGGSGPGDDLVDAASRAFSRVAFSKGNVKTAAPLWMGTDGNL